MPESILTTTLPPALNDLPSSSGILEIGAAYIRVSTDDQTELSPDAQLREILSAAKTDGIVIPREFIFVEEKGRSGRRADNRPEFQRMIATAKQQPAPFKRLYVWKFSRFARNQEESTFYKGVLRRKCGVNIISISEPIIDGMFGRLIEMIIEWFDEYYSINLSGEVIRGMTEKALRNGYQSAPSLGYDAVGGGKPFVIDEDKYAIAAFIHQAYYNGLDRITIARECNNRGYRTRRGNLFDVRSVRSILENEFYIGIVKWKDISFQGTHEIRDDIVSVFTANRERLQREFKPAKRRDVSACAHWLSGLLKCSVCGASLGYRKAAPKNNVAAFQCWKYSKGIHTGSCSVTANKAEKAVLKSLQTVLETGDIKLDLTRPANRKNDSQAEIIKAALSRLEMKEIRVRDAYENEIDTLAEYKSNKIRLQEERDKLLAEMDALVDSTEPAPDKKEVLKMIRAVCQLAENPDVSYQEKGNALRRIVKSIDYNRQKDEFTFHYYA